MCRHRTRPKPLHPIIINKSPLLQRLHRPGNPRSINSRHLSQRNNKFIPLQVPQFHRHLGKRKIPNPNTKTIPLLIQSRQPLWPNPQRTHPLRTHRPPILCTRITHHLVMHTQPLCHHPCRGHGIAIGLFQRKVHVLPPRPFLCVGLAGSGARDVAEVGDADGGGGCGLGVECGVEDGAEGAVDEGSVVFGRGWRGEDFGWRDAFGGVEGVELGDGFGGEEV